MTPYYQDSAVTIYHGDCREILPQLPKVDLVLTDPPYGVMKAEWDTHFPVEWYPMAKKVCDMIGIMTGSAGVWDAVHLVGLDFVDIISGRNMNGMTRGLERTLRALLYQPVERLKRAELALPGHVRRKEYGAASDCQETIRRSKQEIQQWEHLLGLYEHELFP